MSRRLGFLAALDSLIRRTQNIAIERHGTESAHNWISVARFQLEGLEAEAGRAARVLETVTE